MPSVGMSRPATSATAGMRRTTPLSGAAFTRPWPAAAASITSTLRSSPAKRQDAARHRRRRRCARACGAPATPTAPVGLDPGHAQHDGTPRDDRGEHAVIVRQAREPTRELRVEAGDEPRQPVRGQAIGLRHHDVEPDGGGPPAADQLDEPREERARPRPLAVAREARLVDLDDDGGPGPALPRRAVLVRVEDGQAQARSGSRLGSEQHDERDEQQDEAEGPAASAADRAHPRVLGPVALIRLVAGSGRRHVAHR